MGRNGSEWPEWLEPLRPDEITRAALRAAVGREAVSLLDARRLGSWQDVAAGWSRMLVPIAAVLLLFFAGLAHQATPRSFPPTVTLEDLVPGEDREGTLGALTASVEPTPDWALTAVIHPEPDDR